MKSKHVRKLLVLAVAATFPLAATLTPLPDGVQFGVAAAAGAQPSLGWYKNVVDTARTSNLRTCLLFMVSSPIEP